MTISRKNYNKFRNLKQRFREANFSGDETEANKFRNEFLVECPKIYL